MIAGLPNLLICGSLAYWFWDAPDRFNAGMFFALAAFPIIRGAIDAFLDRKP